MKVAFIPKREDAKKSEEGIGCHSHNYFGHTRVRRVGQQLSVAAAEQSHALKHCGIQKSWDNNTLGITFLLQTAGLMLPPQEDTAFLLSALPSHLPWQLCSTSSPPPTVPANPFFLSGAAFWAPTPPPPPSSSAAKPAQHTAPNTLPI